MALIKSSKKSIKQSRKRSAQNAVFKHGLRKAVTTVARKEKKGVAIEAADINQAYSAIDKALKQGVIKKNTAARRKAKVARIANRVAA
jgi:small subunit ribosomal protein S20